MSAPKWQPSAKDRAFLVSPLEGLATSPAPEDAARLRGGYRDFLDGDLTEAAKVANQLLAEDSGLAPAKVLAAQVQFVNAKYRAVADSLAPLVAEQPSYTAAALLLGRTYEVLGELPEAFAVLQPLDHPVAVEQSEKFLPRTAEILGRRIESSLAGGALADAQYELERLRSWVPTERVTAEAWLQVAQASGDELDELGALRSLVEFGTLEDERLKRRAELELDIGDPAISLRLYQDLNRRLPDDPLLVEGLAQVTFVWRMQLLPEPVRDLYRRPVLSRGEFAALLFWLFPDVRYGEAQRGTIATDVLDHGFRSEIVKVVNLGLLPVDPSLHKFFPDREIQRSEVMRGLLSMLDRSASACLADARVPPRGNGEQVCALAAQCHVLSESAACLSSAPISGEEAISLSRRTLEVLEAL